LELFRLGGFIVGGIGGGAGGRGGIHDARTTTSVFHDRGSKALFSSIKFCRKLLLAEFTQ